MRNKIKINSQVKGTYNILHPNNKNKNYKKRSKHILNKFSTNGRRVGLKHMYYVFMCKCVLSAHDGIH